MSTLELSQDLAAKAAKAFRLCRTGKSGFKKDGTGENGVPAEYLTTGKTLMIEPISRLFLGAGNGYMPTQYVIDANTHYVNDYYEDSNGNLVVDRNISKDEAKDKGYQFRPGLKSQGFDLKEEFRRSMELGLSFEGGTLNAGKYGDNPTLLRFLMEHEQNIAAPRSKENRDPKRLKLFTFEPLLKEKDAAKSKPVENFDADLEAINFVASLREKKGDSYEYNEPKLNALLWMLDEGKHLQPGEVIQKFQIVSRMAKNNGALFMEIVNGTMSDYRIAIGVAEELSVITVGAEGAKMVKNEKETTIYSFKKVSASKEDCINELTIYFITQDIGRVDYNEMKRQVEVAKAATMIDNKKRASKK